MATQQERAGVELVVYGSEAELKNLEKLGPLETRKLDVPRYSVFEQVWLPWVVLRDRLDVFHAPTYLCPLLATCPIVITLHDLEQLLVPEVARRGVGYWAVNAMHHMSARRAARIITDSEATRTDVVDHLRIRPAKVTSILCGALDVFEPEPGDAAAWNSERSRLVGPGAFFLAMVHRQVGKKNTVRVLAAHRSYWERGGRARLVFFGDARGARRQLPEMARAEATGTVVNVGRVDGPTLRRLYSNAIAFIFPSLSEGFGLPIVEAMRSGTVVITSGKAAMPEVGGPAAIYVEPELVEQIAAAMGTVERLTAEQRAKRVRNGRERAAELTYSRTAAATLAVYRSLGRQ